MVVMVGISYPTRSNQSAQCMHALSDNVGSYWHNSCAELEKHYKVQ